MRWKGIVKVSGATAMGSGGCNDGNGNGGERRGVRCDARSPVCGASASKRTVQCDNGSSHSTALGIGNTHAVGLFSWASKTAEFVENILLEGELSVALGKALAKVVSTPLWSRSQAKYAHDFVKWAETLGASVITTHPHSVRHGGPSSDAIWENPTVGGDSKTRQMAQRQRRYEKHARRLKETSKLSRATRK